MIEGNETPLHPQTPLGLNHLVIRVRNINESHAFWTELLGFKHVGTLSTSDTAGEAPEPTRFYSGRRQGRLSHHDIALVEDAGVVVSDDASMGLDHFAIEYAGSIEWNRQIAFLLNRNIAVSRRIRRGTTQSAHLQDPNGYTIELVCELPRELWESDIDAALNKAPMFIE